MSAIQERQVFGSLISPAFSFTHGMYTELHHPFADDVCLALAASRVAGIFAYVVHIGAGFGAELRSARFAGARNVIGLDQAQDQVEFARQLSIVIDDEDYISRLLKNDRVVSRLYSSADFPDLGDVAAEAALRCRNEIYQFCHAFDISTAEQYNEELPIIRCDVLKDDVLAVLGGKQRDALIGNIMLHWLVRDGSSLQVGLDKLALAVRSGGVAVFSVPYHFVEHIDPTIDEVLRTHCVYDTNSYRAFRRHLLKRLPDQTMPASADFRKVQPMLIRANEASEGSKHFEHEMTYRRYFSPLGASMTAVLLGLGLYEAVLRTGKPDVEVVDHVVAAVKAAVDEVDCETVTRERPSTYVYFFVFRRK